MLAAHFLGNRLVSVPRSSECKDSCLKVRSIGFALSLDGLGAVFRRSRLGGTGAAVVCRARTRGAPLLA